MNVWLSSYTLALGGIFLVWLGVSAYVVVTRALFDVGNLSFHTARRVLNRRLARGATPEEALHGLPRRTLAGIAADASTPRSLARAAAEQLLRHRSERIIRHATSHRTETDKWRRIAALRILSVADCTQSTSLLKQALSEGDADVAGAAVMILGARGDDESAGLLIDALKRGIYSRSRIAAQLDRFDLSVETDLAPLLDTPDPAVRQWAASLLARYDDPLAELELAALVGDDDPQVRAASLKSLSEHNRSLAAPAAVTALEDPVWFVRVHAARALGRLGGGDAAARLVPLLGDGKWWVRTAAKESLTAMGAAGATSAMEALRSEDEFVRNGAAEILQNTGLLDDLIARVADDPRDDLAGRAIRTIFAAGGRALMESALQRARVSESDAVLLEQLTAS
jgi:HEAT repeat protein